MKDVFTPKCCHSICNSRSYSSAFLAEHFTPAVSTRQAFLLFKVLISIATPQASQSDPFCAYLRSSWTTGMLVTAFHTEIPNMGKRPRYWNTPRWRLLGSPEA